MVWSALTDREKSILRFEEQHWKYAAVKDSEINLRWHMTPTRYYQVLNQLIDKPEALAYAPLVVKRLQRLRKARREQRSSSRLA